MPEVLRSPLRMDCNGIDITAPLDRIPPGFFPYLQNVRVIDEGRIESRPGYIQFQTSASASGGLHSIRRLNDEDFTLAPQGYIYIAGDGSELVAGDILAPWTVIDTGYYGVPLSLIPFRPDVSPQAWMYVYDHNKMAKVNPGKVVKPIGTPPPGGIGETSADYGVPAWVQLDNGQSTAGWAASGSAGAPTLQDRLAVSAPVTILNIVYNSGSTGWCCIQPFSVALNSLWQGNRMQVILNAGAGNQEIVVVREIHPAGINTTIAGIKYDSGSTGLCTVVLAKQPDDASFLQRNTLMSFNAGGAGAEIVRVLSVSLSPDGSTYSFRCSTAGTFTAGQTAMTVVSWYIYTTLAHAAAETITESFVQSANTTPGTSTATIQKTGIVLNAASANNRPISMSEDYMHISLYVTQPFATAYLRLRIYLGGLTGDYYEWTVSPNALVAGWNDMNIPLSEGQRFGDHSGETIAAIGALEISAVMNSLGTIGFDSWYLFGTYGPFVDPGLPVGLLYQSRFRDSTTGTASVPGPQTRQELFPLREDVLVTPPTTAATYIDKIDLYRQGGTLTDFTYVGTVENNNSTPNTYSDELPDVNVQSNPTADYTLLQPWPIQQLPWKGIVNVVGTTVTWVSGTVFNVLLLSGQVILINGVAFQVYSQPDSTTQLQLYKSAGVQTGVSFEVSSPTISAQPLPIAFGPLEGPFAPVVFAVGDRLNPGTLYYSNSANPDGASDQNTLELCPPSEILVTGVVWNGLVFVGSRQTIFLVRYSYLQTLGQPGPVTFQFQKIPSPSGFWAPWAVCAGQDGVYFLGRDGIYKLTEAGAVSITDEVLYQLFPHDGHDAAGANGLAPIDMTNRAALRLSCCDNDLYFDYAAVGD